MYQIDEWEFDVTVSKIQESEVKVQKKVIESIGELEQYESWDDEEENDFGLEEVVFKPCEIFDFPSNILYKGEGYHFEKCEMPMEEILLDGYPEEQEWMFQKLKITKPDNSADYPKAIAACYRQSPEIFLDIFTAKDLKFLHWLYKKDYRGFLKNGHVPGAAFHFQLLGLIRISFESIYFIEIVEEIYDLEAAVTREISKREIDKECEIEQIFRSLLRLYCVVEKDSFRKLVSDCNQSLVDETYFMESLVEKGLLWHRLICYMDENGNDCYSWYEDEVLIKKILVNRKKYHVNTYKTFEREYCIALSREYIPTIALCASLVCKLIIIIDDPHLANFLVATIEDIARSGCDEEEFLYYAVDLLSEYDISVTKAIRNTLIKVHDSYPSGGLKGHTWKEYKQNHLDGFPQISMFDINPFGKEEY